MGGGGGEEDDDDTTTECSESVEGSRDLPPQLQQRRQRGGGAGSSAAALATRAAEPAQGKEPVRAEPGERGGHAAGDARGDGRTPEVAGRWFKMPPAPRRPALRLSLGLNNPKQRLIAGSPKALWKAAGRSGSK